jgi:hypothetical protein
VTAPRDDSPEPEASGDAPRPETRRGHAVDAPRTSSGRYLAAGGAVETLNALQEGIRVAVEAVFLERPASSMAELAVEIARRARPLVADALFEHLQHAVLAATPAEVHDTPTRKIWRP